MSAATQATLRVRTPGLGQEHHRERAVEAGVSLALALLHDDGLRVHRMTPDLRLRSEDGSSLRAYHARRRHGGEGGGIAIVMLLFLARALRRRGNDVTLTHFPAHRRRSVRRIVGEDRLLFRFRDLRHPGADGSGRLAGRQRHLAVTEVERGSGHHQGEGRGRGATLAVLLPAHLQGRGHLRAKAKILLARRRRRGTSPRETSPGGAGVGMNQLGSAEGIPARRRLRDRGRLRQERQLRMRRRTGRRR